MEFEKNRENDNIRAESQDFGAFFSPPFYGTGEMLCWQTHALIENIDKSVLYGRYWKSGHNGSGRLNHTEMEELYTLLIQEIVADQLVDARGYYAFFPVIAEKELLILLDPADFHTEIASLGLPEQPDIGIPSYADFFRPEGDILPVQIVSAGFAFEQRCRKYDEHETMKGRYMKELGTFLGDTLVEKVTREIRRALSLAKEQGVRYRFGDPGMPALSQQGILLDVICAEDRLGVTLDNNFALRPDYSALDIFMHRMQGTNL